MVRIIGSYISPYVRKVLVVLDMKGLSYEIDPIIPFMGDDRFSAVSPVRRIPVLMDDRVTPAEGHLFGDVSIAWSKTAAFVDRVLALRSFQKLRLFEDRCVRTPIARTVLAELGAPLLAETYGTTSPRRG